MVNKYFTRVVNGQVRRFIYPAKRRALQPSWVRVMIRFYRLMGIAKDTATIKAYALEARHWYNDNRPLY